MKEAPIVVVGASLAGLRAVEAFRKGGYDGPLTLVGAEEHLPYDRPPLSKAFLHADHDKPIDTTFRAEDEIRELDVDCGSVSWPPAWTAKRARSWSVRSTCPTAVW